MLFVSLRVTALSALDEHESEDAKERERYHCYANTDACLGAGAQTIGSRR